MNELRPPAALRIEQHADPPFREVRGAAAQRILTDQRRRHHQVDVRAGCPLREIRAVGVGQRHCHDPVTGHLAANNIQIRLDLSVGGLSFGHCPVPAVRLPRPGACRHPRRRTTSRSASARRALPASSRRWHKKFVARSAGIQRIGKPRSALPQRQIGCAYSAPFQPHPYLAGSRLTQLEQLRSEAVGRVQACGPRSHV